MATGAFADVKPAPDVRVPPPQAARGLVVVARGARERSLAVEEFLGSFLLLARVPDAVGRAGGPRALVRGSRLNAEVVEALLGLHRPQLEVGEAARETVRESPQQR